MTPKRNTGTPKQIAFLSYMGFEDAAQLSKEEISEMMEDVTGAYFARYPDTREQREIYHSKDWFNDRFILYPDLYKAELKEYLENTLVEEMQTYIQGQFTGSSERITKSKIKEVCKTLTSENSKWWQNEDKKQIFFFRFSFVYPKCCDGRRPEKKIAAPVQPVGPKLPFATIAANMPPSGKSLSRVKTAPKPKNKKNSIGCGGVALIAIFIWVLFKLFSH